MQGQSCSAKFGSLTEVLVHQLNADADHVCGVRDVRGDPVCLSPVYFIEVQKQPMRCDVFIHQEGTLRFNVVPLWCQGHVGQCSAVGIWAVVGSVAIMVLHRLLCVAGASEESHATKRSPYCGSVVVSFNSFLYSFTYSPTQRRSATAKVSSGDVPHSSVCIPLRRK